MRKQTGLFSLSQEKSAASKNLPTAPKFLSTASNFFSSDLDIHPKAPNSSCYDPEGTLNNIKSVLKIDLVASRHGYSNKAVQKNSYSASTSLIDSGYSSSNNPDLGSKPPSYSKYLDSTPTKNKYSSDQSYSARTSSRHHGSINSDPSKKTYVLIKEDSIIRSNCYEKVDVDLELGRPFINHLQSKRIENLSTPIDIKSSSRIRSKEVNGNQRSRAKTEEANLSRSIIFARSGEYISLKTRDLCVEHKAAAGVIRLVSFENKKLNKTLRIDSRLVTKDPHLVNRNDSFGVWMPKIRSSLEFDTFGSDTDSWSPPLKRIKAHVHGDLNSDFVGSQLSEYKELSDSLCCNKFKDFGVELAVSIGGEKIHEPGKDIENIGVESIGIIDGLQKNILQVDLNFKGLSRKDDFQKIGNIIWMPKVRNRLELNSCDCDIDIGYPPLKRRKLNDHTMQRTYSSNESFESLESYGSKGTRITNIGVKKRKSMDDFSTVGIDLQEPDSKKFRHSGNFSDNISDATPINGNMDASINVGASTEGRLSAERQSLPIPHSNLGAGSIMNMKIITETVGQEQIMEEDMSREKLKHTTRSYWDSDNWFQHREGVHEISKGAKVIQEEVLKIEKDSENKIYSRKRKWIADSPTLESTLKNGVIEPTFKRRKISHDSENSKDSPSKRIIFTEDSRHTTSLPKFSENFELPDKFSEISFNNYFHRPPDPDPGSNSLVLRSLPIDFNLVSPLANFSIKAFTSASSEWVSVVVPEQPQKYD